MSWRPLVEDRDGAIRTAIRDIAAALAGAALEPFEQADHAVMRTYLAADDTVADDDGVAIAAVEAAMPALGAPLLDLYHGVTRIGWTVAHLADGEVADEVCRGIDARLDEVVDAWTGDYDLVSGLAGWGVYALERGAPALVARIVAQLARRVAPEGAWFTVAELVPENQRAVAPDGYWNLGLAHGTPGVIGLLARCVAADIEAATCRRLLAGALAYLSAVPRPTGSFPQWLPPERPATPRLAWCYGDLGVAVAMTGAGVLAGEPAWRDAGLELARTCAARTVDEAAIFDAGICHGAAGIAHLFHRLARATGDAVLADAGRAWIDRALAMRRAEGYGGFPRVYGDTVVADASLLTGAAGVALVLHAAVSEVEPLWDRLLLADLPHE